MMLLGLHCFVLRKKRSIHFQVWNLNPPAPWFLRLGAIVLFLLMMFTPRLSARPRSARPLLSLEPRKSALGPVWLGCMRALHAFGRGDFSEAAVQFDEVAALTPPSSLDEDRRIQTAGLGNSSEQRDCLEEAYVLSLLRSGRYEDAAALVECRLKVQPTERLSRRNQHWWPGFSVWLVNWAC